MNNDILLDFFNSASLDEVQTTKILGGGATSTSEIECTDSGDPGDSVDTAHETSYDENGVEMCNESWTTQDTIPYSI